MIPSTAAGVLALLGCIAPGLVFQLRRERFMPRADDSLLRETSRIALTSLVFTATATMVLVAVSTKWAVLPDVGEWLRRGHGYLPTHYRSVSLFVVLIVGGSCGLAVLFEWVTRSDVHGKISPQSIWFMAFRQDSPESTKRVRLWVTTQDGTQFRGNLRHFTTDIAQDNRELSLGGSTLERLPANAPADSDWEKLTDFDAVLLPGADIRHVAVSYVGPENVPLRRTTPPPAGSWRRRWITMFRG
jgi:hypothetical protein